MKKVYFSGSISGGRRDAEVYAKIIEKLKTKFVVLTEHIGSSDLTQKGETDMTPEEIYFKDIKLIDECDFVFAEVTQTSMGVGYEIAYAESLGKTILCFVNESKNPYLSAMIKGNPHLILFKYSDIGEVFNEIDKMN